MKPICVKCQRFYNPKQNGVTLMEQMPDGTYPKARPGLADNHRWSPYKLWMGDLWECETCGSNIIVGVGTKPISEHFMPGFAEELKHAGGDSVLRVNDC